MANIVQWNPNSGTSSPASLIDWPSDISSGQTHLYFGVTGATVAGSTTHLDHINDCTGLQQINREIIRQGGGDPTFTLNARMLSSQIIDAQTKINVARVLRGDSVFSFTTVTPNISRLTKAMIVELRQALDTNILVIPMKSLNDSFMGGTYSLEYYDRQDNPWKTLNFENAGNDGSAGSPTGKYGTSHVGVFCDRHRTMVGLDNYIPQTIPTPIVSGSLDLYINTKLVDLEGFNIEVYMTTPQVANLLNTTSYKDFTYLLGSSIASTGLTAGNVLQNVPLSAAGLTAAKASFRKHLLFVTNEEKNELGADPNPVGVGSGNSYFTMDGVMVSSGKLRIVF